MGSGLHARFRKKRVPSTGKGWRTPKGSGSIRHPPIQSFSSTQVFTGSQIVLTCRERNAKRMTSVICVSGPHCECSPPCSLRKDRSLQAEWGYLREGGSGGALCQVKSTNHSMLDLGGDWEPCKVSVRSLGQGHLGSRVPILEPANTSGIDTEETQFQF